MGSFSYVKSFYLLGEYIKKNPSMHEEDSPWKVQKILPLVDMATGLLGKKTINILDVGGGAGMILKSISEYVNGYHRRGVNKYLLDLSPGMLEVQCQNNPDYKLARNEDICSSRLGDKEIDVTLLIDVLEHLEDPAKALKEISRISRFAIFKVPLEDNLSLNLSNLIRRGQTRRELIENYGHINAFNYPALSQLVEQYCGDIISHSFTNVFEYDHLLNRPRRFNRTGRYASRISPGVASMLLGDYAMMLVKCR